MLYYATQMSYPYWKLLLCVDVTFDMDVIDMNIGCGTHAAVHIHLIVANHKLGL